jgi:hypothetical protein
MMNVGRVNIKVGISLTRQEYSVLKEGIKDDECGWSYQLEIPFSLDCQLGTKMVPGTG